ncbi:MAG: hypothetical protein H6825_05555 [Planctomycetes bacterium]|nr:hypothetical protein [Planctomycetota bacterium]
MVTCLRARAVGLATAVVLLGVPASAPGQILREQHLGSSDLDLFGYSSANIGDVDDDGIDDFAVGSPRHDTGGLVDAGRVTVFSGATGSVIRTHDAPTAGDYLGYAVAGAGDVDGDDVPDYIVSAPYHSLVVNFGGRVVVYSGHTGAPIWSRFGTTQSGFLGISVAGIGDLDGDGRSDVAIGSTKDEMWVVGSSGQTIHHLTGSPGIFFGYAVTGCDDLDGDGVNDFAVSSLFAGVGPFTELGAVNAYSGANAAYLHTTFGSQTHDTLGRTLAKLGDVNGDGVGDYVAGSAFAGAPGADDGLVAVIDGATGSIIREHRGDTVVEYEGQSVTGLGDVDHDGVPDYASGAVQAGPGHEGRVRVWSGSSGAKIWEWTGVPGSNAQLGASVAGGDWNGDGTGDLVCGDETFSDGGASPGSLDVYLMCPAWTQNYGAGWPGKNGIPSLTLAQTPVVGAPIDIQIGNSLGADTLAALFIGVETADIPFAFSGTLLVTPPAPSFILVFPLPAAGISIGTTLPDAPELFCADLFLQVIEVDAFASVGRSFTPGLQLRCGFDLP